MSTSQLKPHGAACQAFVINMLLYFYFKNKGVFVPHLNLLLGDSIRDFFKEDLLKEWTARMATLGIPAWIARYCNLLPGNLMRMQMTAASAGVIFLCKKKKNLRYFVIFQPKFLIIVPKIFTPED